MLFLRQLKYPRTARQRQNRKPNERNPAIETCQLGGGGIPFRRASGDSQGSAVPRLAL